MPCQRSSNVRLLRFMLRTNKIASYTRTRNVTRTHFSFCFRSFVDFSYKCANSWVWIQFMFSHWNYDMTTISHSHKGNKCSFFVVQIVKLKTWKWMRSSIHQHNHWSRNKFMFEMQTGKVFHPQILSSVWTANHKFLVAFKMTMHVIQYTHYTYTTWCFNLHTI